MHKMLGKKLVHSLHNIENLQETYERENFVDIVNYENYELRMRLLEKLEFRNY
jgi:hypothetical protein